MRAGTENVSGIMSFKAAATERHNNLVQDYQKAVGVRDIFYKSLNGLGDIIFNGGGENSPYIMSVSFKGIKAETLAALLDERGVIVGLGSACSASYSDNRVLSSMGIKKSYAEGSIRISISPETTMKDAETAAGIIVDTVKELRK